MPRLFRRVLKLLIIPVATVAFIAAWLGVQLNTGNFHTVVEGELYRSAQPEGNDIATYAREHGIKSIINLRGENANSDWYRSEVAESKRLGITHLNFRMKAARELTPEQANELIAMMKSAPKPLLIHCYAGADRSGLASALYLRMVKAEPSEKADNQLSLRYGHVPLWWLDAQAMTRTYNKYIAGLSTANAHTPATVVQQ